MMLFPLLTTDECVVAAIAASGNVLNDPGAGKRIKNEWYLTKKYGRVKWMGTTFSCEHGRQRSQCKECGGSKICEHGRRRSQCKECGGSQVCEHGRVRSQCKECGGSQICEHGRIRSTCKECGGSQVCEHGRRRSQCKECSPKNKMSTKCEPCKT